MKDEIKEIMDNMREWSVEGNLYFEINDEKAKLLYDYITNLQEENKEQKKQLESLIVQLELYKDNHNYLNDKIDKAIEYIKENSYFEGNEIKTMIYQDYSKYILEILQGKSDE